MSMNEITEYDQRCTEFVVAVYFHYGLPHDIDLATYVKYL